MRTSGDLAVSAAALLAARRPGPAGAPAPRRPRGAAPAGGAAGGEAGLGARWEGSRLWRRPPRRRAGRRCWSPSRCRRPASSRPTRCWSARRAAAAAACSPPCPTRSTCSRSAPPPGRGPAAGFAEIARAGSGPLADELRGHRRRARLRPASRRGARGAARARPGQRDRDALRLDRALAPLRLAARRPAAPPGRLAAPRPAPRGRGARRPRRPQDPARRRPRPRPLGPADDRRRPDRQRRRPARRLLRRGWRSSCHIDGKTRQSPSFLLQRLLAQAGRRRRRRRRASRRARRPSSCGR